MHPQINKHHEDRPWGGEECFTENVSSTVKIITVNPGEALSLQTHMNREEFWHVLSGSGFAQVGDEIKEVKAGDEFWVPKGTKHRMTGGDTQLRFLEISLGEFDESDIIRLEDKYGRVTSSN